MVEYAGRQVMSGSEVNDITRERIKTITGGIDDEMKRHRNALWALSVLSFPQGRTTIDMEKANDIAGDSEKFNDMIESIVKEGKAVKAANGWV